MLERFRITGAVREENAIGMESKDVIRSRIRRNNGDSGANLNQMAKNVALDSVVKGDYVELIGLNGSQFIRWRDRIDAVRPAVGLGRRDLRDEVLARHGG